MKKKYIVIGSIVVSLLLSSYIRSNKIKEDRIQQSIEDIFTSVVHFEGLGHISDNEILLVEYLDDKDMYSLKTEEATFRFHMENVSKTNNQLLVSYYELDYSSVLMHMITDTFIDIAIENNGETFADLTYDIYQKYEHKIVEDPLMYYIRYNGKLNLNDKEELNGEFQAKLVNDDGLKWIISRKEE